jgi:hypothetical protein
MTEACCHSDRKAVFSLMRNLFFQQGTLMFSKKERFFSCKKLLQKDRGVLSFRQRSRFLFDEESFCHSDRKAVFALTRNLFLSARKLYVFEKGKILQSQKAPSK